MPQSVLLQARGLYTFPNTLSEVPQGALTQADNTVIDRNGVIEPRRGLQQYGTTFGLGTDTASQLMTYKKTLLMQYDSTIQYDSDNAGTWMPFSGSYAPVQVGLRTKYTESNGNLYFTSSTGIQCISASSASQFTTAPNFIRPAGSPQALDLTGVVDYSTAGWFIYQSSSPGQSKVAYRMTWAFKDANQNLVEGAPSSRLVLTNYSTTASATVNLTFQIPPGVDNTNFFYTIYRTAVVQTSTGVTLQNLDPGDEEYQVIQNYVTSADLAAGSITINDPTPESFRANGALLYTNPISGAGILQSNYQPPLALDITLYQGTLFFANTQSIQQLNLALLSTENLTSGVSQVLVTQGLTTNTYTFLGTPEIQKFTFDTKANTVDGGYFLLNAAVNVRKYFVWFNKSGLPAITNVTFPAYSGITNGGYFLINGANDTDKYFVWFDSTGTTLAPTGADTLNRTGIRVPITSGMADTDVANAVVAACSGNPDFTPSLTGTPGVVQFTNLANGPTTLASEGLVPVGAGWSATSIQTGVASTPAPTTPDTVGRLGIEVDITQAVSAADVASATNIALNENNDFISVIDLTDDPTGATIEVTNGDNGYCTAAVNGYSISATAGSLVNTGTSTITIPNNGLNDTEITYTSSGAPIGGLTSGDTYYVINATTNTFQLSTQLNGSPITLTSQGSGTQTFSVGVGGAFTFSQVQAGTGGSPANIATQQVLLGNNVSPAISIEETARSLVQCINANPASVIEAFYVSGPTDLPGLILLQGRNISSPTFWVTADSTATGDEFSPSLPTSGESVISTNTVQLNAIYYSKFQQPEAVPTVNYFLVGPKDKAILRILPIRTGLMIFKEDGIYQLTGTNGQFVVNPFDSSALLLAPDSAVVLNNQVYMFCTQGIVAVSDTGVSVISRPIENSLQQIISPAYDYVPNTFGVAYESDRAYLLWTVTNSNDDQPTQCFRYNTFTTAWTRWPIAKTCGVVLINTNVLYVGAADENFIEQERKNINRTDYADRQYLIGIPENPIFGPDEVTLSSSANVDDGDVLVQTQYLTTYQFNQLLMMLDADYGTTYKQYFATFQVMAGSDLRAALNNLAAQLDIDSGLNESNFLSSMGGGANFVDFQNDFNILTNLLNNNAHTSLKNYRTSTGTVNFEMIVTGVVSNSNNIITNYIPPIIVGPIILTKGITTTITWSPQTFGDPSIAKHVSEGTFIFDNDIFTSATISYASDLMPAFTPIDFNENGLGDWGLFVWDGQAWGGNGVNTPIRTYIPRNNQYCRYILPQFSHNIAREKFALFGTSLTFRPIGERAYRS